MIGRALLLVSLLLALTACGGGAQAPAGAQHPASAAAGTAPGGGATMPASARAMLEWLPLKTALAGWTAAKEPQAFGPDDLWEAIDGAAETYLAFGFEELVSVACRTANGADEATIEMYRMADALHAFGVYAQERNASARFLQAGNEGYAAANVLNFWHGRHYIKVTATSEQAAATLPALAAAISQRMGTPPAAPSELALLPAEGQVAHSVKYVPADVLGQSYLRDAIEAQYGGPAKPWRLLVMTWPKPDDATAAFDRYRTFLGSAARPFEGPALAGVIASDKVRGLVVAARAGSRIAIAIGAPSPAVGREFVSRTLAIAQ